MAIMASDEARAALALHFAQVFLFVISGLSGFGDR
jgi:hypothetical protein